MQVLHTFTNEPNRASHHKDYVNCWATNGQKADSQENQHLALYYLRQSTQLAFWDIQRTRVERGVAIWYIYNMGYVFKTPDACFGIDIKMRDAEKMVDLLDFLLITHEHQDHYSSPTLTWGERYLTPGTILKTGKDVK